MKKLSVVLLMLTMSVGFSQENLNNYKYIVIPKKFDAFKKENQHKTSTLVKFLFSKEGFNTVYDDALPEDLRNNRCSGLTAIVNDDSSLFTTKTSIVLKDCDSNQIVTTVKGSSKEKDYESAYREALTEAFGTIKAMDYKYEPIDEKTEPITVSFKNDVKSVVKGSKNKIDNKVVQQKATPDEQLYKSHEPIASQMVKKESVQDNRASTGKENAEILYAQEIPGGYQLVDSTPKIRLKLFRTSFTDVYVVQYENDNGVVYKKGGKWYLEYHSGKRLNTKELNIKF